MGHKLPIGIQSFEDLRNKGFLYIDKTALVYKLASEGKYYFLSRPRRFGKSLFLSTLEAYFQGKKELFGELAIEQLEKDWIEYPILHLDLNTEKYETREALELLLNNFLSRWEKLYGSEASENSLGTRFMGVIRRALGQDVLELASNLNCSEEDAYALLKVNYDGYRFCSEEKPGLYNPFSVLNALASLKIDSYWFETGTPTFLVELLKRHGYNIPDLEKEEPNADVLNSVDSMFDNPIPVIYQSGYLTVKGYDPRFGLYRLGFPNREVKEGFLRFLLPYYANVDKVRSAFEISRFVREIEGGDVDGFMTRLQTFLSNCPFELQPEQERHVQSIVYAVATLCGLYADVEEHTNRGSIDMTIKTDRYIFIFEFKFNQSARKALEQIRDRGYAEKFAADGRQTICIGVNYDYTGRNISEWIVE